MNIHLKNLTFWNDGKGCFLYIDSNSKVSINVMKFDQIFTNNSLIYIDNSQLLLENIQINGLFLSKNTKDGLYFWIDSSNVSINHLSAFSFNMQLFYQQNAMVLINNSIFDNQGIIGNNQYLSMFYAYYVTELTIFNTIISNHYYKQGVFIENLSEFIGFFGVF